MVAVALDTTSALVEGVVAVDAVGGVRWNRFHCLILRQRLELQLRLTRAPFSARIFAF